jgi:xanthine dehydrogenase YagS FAD-binding subunit
VWDFSLVNVAAAFQVENGTIQESRVVCGAVQATPRRLQNVEQAIRGKAKGAVTAASVTGMASAGARALAHNGFKIPLMENLVKRAISA